MFIKDHPTGRRKKKVEQRLDLQKIQNLAQKNPDFARLINVKNINYQKGTVEPIYQYDHWKQKVPTKQPFSTYTS